MLNKEMLLLGGKSGPNLIFHCVEAAGTFKVTDATGNIFTPTVPYTRYWECELSVVFPVTLDVRSMTLIQFVFAEDNCVLDGFPGDFIPHTGTVNIVDPSKPAIVILMTNR